MESNLGIVNIKYKGTRMNFRTPSKYGLYYLHVSQIQHNPGMTAMIYDINDYKKLKDT